MTKDPKKMSYKLLAKNAEKLPPKPKEKYGERLTGEKVREEQFARGMVEEGEGLAATEHVGGYRKGQKPENTRQQFVQRYLTRDAVKERIYELIEQAGAQKMEQKLIKRMHEVADLPFGDGTVNKKTGKLTMTLPQFISALREFSQILPGWRAPTKHARINVNRNWKEPKE